MALYPGPSRGRSRNAFSPVQVFTVCVLIGSLAVLSVPRFLQISERNKASNALDYLGDVHAAQERYQASQGAYSADISLLDLPRATPTYFSVGQILPVDADEVADTWSLSLTRCGGTSGYGPYTVTFTNRGYDSSTSNLPAEITP